MLNGRRILMTADTLGGVWQYACSLAPALGELGCEVLLAVLGPEPDKEQRAVLTRLDGVELIASGLPLDWVGSERTAMSAAAETLAEIAAEARCDLVHLNSPLLAAGALFPAPVVAAAHGCISTWWQAARAEPLDPAFHWHRDMTAKALRISDAVVAPTRAYAEILKHCYGSARPIEAVHNGRDLLPGEKCLASHDFAFTAGRFWDDAKNTPVLDAVAEQLPFPFYAAGRTEGPNGERRKLHHLHPLGQLGEAEVAQWLGARPVFATAARFEPFGLAVLEAAQAGCPLVLSDIPTFRELWDGAAIFIRVDDIGGYAAAITECVIDPMQRQHWGDLARERAKAYTPRATAAGMARIYRALLDRKAAA